MATYDLSVKLDSRPKGDEIEVFPHGVVKNGEGTVEIEVTAEEAKALGEIEGFKVVKSKGGDS